MKILFFAPIGDTWIIGSFPCWPKELASRYVVTYERTYTGVCLCGQGFCVVCQLRALLQGTVALPASIRERMQMQEGPTLSVHAWALRERRSELESEHGDAFTLLAMFDEWIKVKARRQESARWVSHPPAAASQNQLEVFSSCSPS